MKKVNFCLFNNRRRFILRILLPMFLIMWHLTPCELSASSGLLTEDIGKAYLGKPYVSHPLAKSSPLGFDCTTYVEEVLAERYENPSVVRRYIRYRDGVTGFFHRNHFMEEMWIPNALRYGVIATIALPGREKSLLKVDLVKWYRGNQEIAIKDAAYYRQADTQKRFTTSISYVPADQITEELLKKLPAETVVFFLRCYSQKPYPWVLNNNAAMVTHMGFLFGGSRFYHASKAKKQVIREDFSLYLQAHPNLCGVAFYEIGDITASVGECIADKALFRKENAY